MQRVWEELSGDRPLPTWPDNPIKQYALALTKLLYEDTDGSMKTLMAIVEKMKPSFMRPLELYRYVRPLWVNAAAAENLMTARRTSPLVALNGERVCWSDNYLDTDYYTLDRYLERSGLYKGSRKVAQVTHADANLILRAIREQVDKQWEANPMRVDKRLRELKMPLIALVPATDGIPDQRLLDSLQRLREHHCPSLIYVIHTGPHLPAEGLGKISPVQPALDPEIEYDRYRDEFDLRTMLPFT